MRKLLVCSLIAPAIAAVLAPPDPLLAQKDSAARLLGWCRKVQAVAGNLNAPSTDKVEALLCTRYLTGYVDGFSRRSDPVACIPSEVTPAQLAAVFVKWADANPQVWHFEADVTVGAALVITFPCHR